MSNPNEVNGAAAAAAQQPTTDEVIDTQLRQTLGFMIRGILVSAPGVSADVITRSIARITGELIGQAVVGPLTDVLTIRRMCKESFADGMSKIPVRDFAPGERPPEHIKSALLNS